MMIDHQIMDEGGKPEYIVVCHVGKRRNPLLIVELKRPERWNHAGKLDELLIYAEGCFRMTLSICWVGLVYIGRCGKRPTCGGNGGGLAHQHQQQQLV